MDILTAFILLLLVSLTYALEVPLKMNIFAQKRVACTIITD